MSQTLAIVRGLLGFVMRSFFAKHVGAIATGTIINLPFLWKGAIWITDWLARFDFWNTHGRELAGLNSVVGFLTDPPPWTVFLTSAAAVLIVYWDVRRQARIPEATIDSVRKLKLTFFGGCAAILAAVWVMAWPLYFPAKAAVAQAPAPTIPTTPKPKLKSTLGRMLFKCAPPDDPDPRAMEKYKVEYKNYIKIFADTFGLSIKMTEVPGGDKVEMTPLTTTGQNYMGMVSKMTIEIRRFNQSEILGIYTAEFGGLAYPASYAALSVDPGSDSENTARQSIEKLAAAEKGGCKLL